MHQEITALFGGAQGVLNEGTLDYAAHRAANSKDPIAEAAILLTTIAREHPFMDGNKRTAFLAADTILRINRIHLKTENEEPMNFMLQVARGELGHKEVMNWLGNRVKRLS